MITLEIVNTNIEKDVNINIENIVNNHIDYIVFSDSLDKRSVALEYIEVPELTTNKNLHINDLFWSKQGNSSNFYKTKDSIFFVDRYNFTINSKEVLITHKYIYDNEGEVLPLFYKHKTKNGKRILSAELKTFTKGKRNTEEQGFFFDKDQGIIYTNYKNHFDLNTYEYNIYLVTGIDYDNNPFTELLNPEPVIKELSWEDIDPETGLIKKDYFCFQRQLNNQGKYFVFDILTSESKLGLECSQVGNVNGFYVKMLESTIIRLKNPDSFGLENPWYLKISNSESFLENDLYKLPEYDTQPFYPEKGFIQLLNKDCFFVKEGIIKLPVENVKLDPGNEFHFNLYVLDEDDTLIYYYSTNESIVGKIIDNIECKKFEYINCDEESGFVSLSPSVLYNQKLKADFIYYSKDYVYTDVDFNPVNNKRVRENIFVLYMKPYNSNLSKSAFYLELDYNGIILNSNDSLNKINWLGMNYEDWKEEYISSFLLLGEVKLQDKTKEKEIFNFDLRKYDYLSTNNFKDAINKNHKILQSKYGYGENGMVIQKNNLMLINTPYYLLEEYGGEYFFQKETDTNYNKKFSLKNIERLVRSRIPQDIDLLFDIQYRKSSLKIERFGLVSLKLSYTWEGPGVYKIVRKNSLLENNYEVLLEEEYMTRPFTSGVKDLIVKNLTLEDANKYYYAIVIDNEPTSNFVSASD